MRSVLQRIATGPELSRDLTREEARLAMALVLEGRVPAVQAGVFLIALRMKRESDEENLGILDAVRAATRRVVAPVDDLLDVSDPYDGFLRSLPLSPFLPALLAACGQPAVSHGLERVGPKFGVTHRQVLRAAGLPVDLAPGDAAARVAHPDIGWAYLDQRAFCPALHALVDLRTLIVKRPALTTVERLSSPLHARLRTHLMAGFVHKAYPRVYAMLARAAGFDSALLVRGVEGGVIPSLRQAVRCWRYRDGGAESEVEVDPSASGIAGELRAVPVPEHAGADAPVAGDDGATDRSAIAEAAVEAGRAALAGGSGPARDALIYGAALALWHLGRRPTLEAAAAAARRALDSGAAATRFEAAR